MRVPQIGEWYLEPLSPLERTLRFPELVKQLVAVIIERFVFKVFLLSLIFYFIFMRGMLVLNIALSVLVILAWEMFMAKSWWDIKVLPRCLENAQKVKMLHKNIRGLQNFKLVESIEEAVKISVWGTVRGAYMALPSYLWENIIRVLFPIISRNNNYRDLLIGLQNKNIESDIALWEVATEEDLRRRKIRLNKYLDNYGSKVIDADLALPTLRENSEAINSLLKAYKETRASPKDKLLESRKKREAAQSKIRGMFKVLVKIAQENVSLREDRRFYEFISDYDIRQLLLSLGKRLKLSRPEGIFSMTWSEIKKNANYN